MIQVLERKQSLLEKLFFPVFEIFCVCLARVSFLLFHLHTFLDKNDIEVDQAEGLNEKAQNTQSPY